MSRFGFGEKNDVRVRQSSGSAKNKVRVRVRVRQNLKFGTTQKNWREIFLLFFFGFLLTVPQHQLFLGEDSMFFYFDLSTYGNDFFHLWRFATYEYCSWFHGFY